MWFTLDVLPARKGDCLVLHYGSGKDDRHLVIIDGGPSGVYRPHLKPRIAKVRDAHELDSDKALPVEVVLVSHVDDDHIKGILELTAEQRDRPEVRLAVTSLWHNSFDDLLGTKPSELQAGFGAAALGGGDGGAGGEKFDSGSVLAGLGTSALADGIDLESEDAFQTVNVLASIPQGRQLRDDAEALEWPLNHKFGGELILAANSSKPVSLDGDLKLTVVGPMQPELLALQKAHDKWLRDRKVKPEAALAAFVDASVPNLSSIVLLAEFGGKSMLLTGDARGDKILEGMELVGLFEKGGTTHVDVLKVPHHGSQNNMDTIFFKRVTADHYVFSGDGEHGNPERETMQMLFDARGDAPFTIHLTYPIEMIDVKREADWQEQQAKEIRRRDRETTEAEKQKVKVRNDWSAAEHSLTAFFKDHGLAAGQTIHIVDERQPHLIDLLDPLEL